MRCSAHVIDLALEDICKLAWADSTVKTAKDLVNWLRNHSWVLQLVRDYVNADGGCKKEPVRPGDAAFAAFAAWNVQTQPRPTQLYTILTSAMCWAGAPVCLLLHGGTQGRRMLGSRGPQLPACMNPCDAGDTRFSTAYIMCARLGVTRPDLKKMVEAWGPRVAALKKKKTRDEARHFGWVFAWRRVASICGL